MSTEKNCIDCGCKDNTAPVMPPLGSGGDCPNPEPCSTITPAECVVFTGNDKLCGEDTVYESGDRLPTVLSSIVDYFCGRTNTIPTVPTTVSCGRLEVYEEGDSFDVALAKVVQHFCGINNVYFEVEYSEIATLISENGLFPGALYNITDKGIYLKALSNNVLSSSGIRTMRVVKSEYYVPATGILGVWNPSLTPTIGDVVVWGGKVWQNVTGLVGSITDDTTLNAEWNLIPTATSTYYFSKTFGCMYDLANDWVSKQWDDRGNVFSYDFITNLNNTGYPYNPIDISDWGNEKILNNNCWYVFNNAVNNTIHANNLISGGIYLNICSGSIFKNTNLGDIAMNTGNSIFQNSNAGDVAANNVSNSIALNSNLGNVSSNSCVDILNNLNLGSIESNSNTAVIRFNSNSGSIANIGSANDNIFYNTNNGSITTTTTGDISDPIVNK